MAPEPAPEAEPELAPLPEPVFTPPPPPLPAAETTHWYDGFTFGAFADAYFSQDFNAPKSPQQTRVNPTRAYDTANGFGLSWVGLDVQKAPEPVGGTIALRFGPTAQRLNSACVDSDNCDGSSALGLSYVKQAFVSFRPGGSEGIFTVDLGKFDTPYGAEVAEAQYNINYTRGVLYWLGQPAYHTGFRLGFDPERHVNVKVLAVNGWNRTIDNNTGKTFGFQATFRAPKAPDSDADVVTVALGYMLGPEHGDTAYKECPPGQVFNPEASPETGCVTGTDGETSGVVDRGGSNTKGLRHFVDLTVAITPGDALKIFVNGSLGVDNHRETADSPNFVGATWWGVMAGARYAPAEPFGIALREEYFADLDGYAIGSISLGKDIRVLTNTLTFDYSPAKPVKFMLDGRLDWSNFQIFPAGVRDSKGTAFSLTLGALFTTN
jgi:hypothetical protein